ncbi:MAG TPA: M23 family metallopeptidase [Bacteroidales bacterium]|nr:M23 family metallopeptidase [Bacteroidales bacterium]
MGKKVKYHFNTKSLAVERVSETFWDKVRGFLRIVLSGMVFSVIVLSIGYTIFDSPAEKALKREIAQYRTQYQILSDRLDIFETVISDLQERDDHIYRVIFEAEPIPSTVREAAFGGADRYSHLEGMNNSEMIIATAQRVDRIARQLYVQSHSFDEVFEMAKNKTEMLASIPAIIPIALGTDRLVSGFGYRIHPIYKKLRMHTGVDFIAPTGTPIYSTGNGVVRRAQRNFSGYGLMVEIDHGFGYATLYAHMHTIKVQPGQRVSRGEVIGTVGNTGLSTAPHLHYEVIRNGRKVNPVHYFFNDLTPEEFEHIYEVASRVNQSLS